MVPGIGYFVKNRDFKWFKFGMMKRLRQGLWNGQPPYGYTAAEGRLEIDPEEERIVKKVFELYVEKNMGVIHIAKELGRMGYRPRNSIKGRWRANTVHNILRNPIYIGRVKWGGEEAEGAHSPLIEKEALQVLRVFPAAELRHLYAGLDSGGYSRAEHHRGAEKPIDAQGRDRGVPGRVQTVDGEETEGVGGEEGRNS